MASVFSDVIATAAAAAMTGSAQPVLLFWLQDGTEAGSIDCDR